MDERRAQTVRRAALDAQAGQRRERQAAGAADRRFGVEVLVAIGERDAAERRAGELLQTMIDREQLSLRQAVAWLGNRSRSAAATRLLELARSDVAGAREEGIGSVSGRKPV